jgi:hypothetical protein
MGPIAKALGPLAHGYAQLGGQGHQWYEPTSIFESVPADGHQGQLQEHGDFGTPPSFKQLFGQASACPYIKKWACRR